MKNGKYFKLVKVVLIFWCFWLSGLVAKAQVSVQEVVDTELAFAKMAVDQETRAAFLAFMSENSLLERQGKLVKGRSVYLLLPPDTTGKLIWYPTVAAISASGELGYTSGPYTYQVKGKAVAFGDFATVWEKQADNQWKFVIDLGNSHEPVYPETDQVPIVKINPEAGLKNKNLKNDLVQIDQDLNEQLQQGSPLAYLPLLHPAARILRPGKPPVISAADKKALFSQKLNFEFIPQGMKLASANDLGVVYGTCTIAEPASKINPQKGIYMHVWRKDAQKGWQLLHESINLAPKK